MNIHSLLDYLEAELGKGSSIPLTLSLIHITQPTRPHSV